MLISYEMFINDKGIARNWFNIEDEYSFVVNNFLSNSYNENQYLDNKFLNIALSIERYCKIKYQSENLSHFKKRIDFILERYENVLAQFFIPDENWSRKVTETRHFIIHESVEEKYQEFIVRDHLELHNLLIQTTFLLKSICFANKQIS